jgi:hypothetical protein
VFPDPPVAATEAADKLAKSLQGMSHVAAASVEVLAVDKKDRPGVWYTLLRVTATDSDALVELSDGVRAVLAERSAGSSRVEISLDIPGNADVAPTNLQDLAPDTVAAAAVLRTWAEIGSVGAGAFGDGSVYVTLNQDKVSIPGFIDRLRKEVIDPPGGHIDVTFGWGERGVVTTTATWPHDELAAALEQIRTMPGVQRIAASPPVDAGFSPTVTINTTSPQDVADVLAETPAGTSESEPTKYYVRDPETGEEVNSHLSPTIG